MQIMTTMSRVSTIREGDMLDVPGHDSYLVVDSIVPVPGAGFLMLLADDEGQEYPVGAAEDQLVKQVHYCVSNALETW